MSLHSRVTGSCKRNKWADSFWGGQGVKLRDSCYMVKLKRQLTVSPFVKFNLRLKLDVVERKRGREVTIKYYTERQMKVRFRNIENALPS